MNTKIVKYWAFSILLISCILSILLYKERVIYVDSALQIFEMINKNSFSIYVERYSMFFNQLLPVILIKLEAPLYLILISYSISGVLIHLICFLLCFYVFKNKESAICIVSFLIMYRQAYFHGISETYFSIGYSALFYACINYFIQAPNSSKLLFYSISFILVILNYFMHPITFFLLSFSVCFTAFNLKAYKSFELYTLLLFIALVFISKFLFTSNGHENNYYSELKGDHIFNLMIHSKSLLYLTDSLKNIFLLPAILFILTITLYIYDKQYMTAVFITGMILFFIAVNAITFNKGDSTLVMETRFSPLYFFICIPLFNILLKNTLLFYVTLTALSFQIIIAISCIYEIGNSLFKQRLETLAFSLKNQNVKKGLIFEQGLCKDQDLLVTWGCSVETLLYTSLEGKEKSRTLFISNQDPTIDNSSNKESGLFMFMPWWQYYNVDKLNSTYFGLSREPYVVIESLK